MDYENIILEKENDLAVLSINRPKVLNALNKPTVLEIQAALKDVANDDNVKVLIITGAGNKAFIAGADIAAMAELTPLEAKVFSDLGNDVFRSLELMDKPVIAAINGFALGGGCELAMACDFRIAAKNARFGQPEVGLGVIPGFGGTQRLPRLISPGMAKQLLYTGDVIDADEALRIGLVNQVVELEELMPAVKKIAGRIANKGQIAVGLCKKAVDSGIQTDMDRAISMEASLFSLCCATADQKEGMKAFLEKRKPVFQNK